MHSQVETIASDGYILETRNLVKEFKGFLAVNDVSLRVRAGSIHGLIGPNGAGKTTVFNLLTKFPTRGTIWFKGGPTSRVTSRRRLRAAELSAPFRSRRYFPT